MAVRYSTCQVIAYFNDDIGIYGAKEQDESIRNGGDVDNRCNGDEDGEGGNGIDDSAEDQSQGQHDESAPLAWPENGPGRDHGYAFDKPHRAGAETQLRFALCYHGLAHGPRG